MGEADMPSPNSTRTWLGAMRDDGIPAAARPARDADPACPSPATERPREAARMCLPNSAHSLAGSAIDLGPGRDTIAIVIAGAPVRAV